MYGNARRRRGGTPKWKSAEKHKQPNRFSDKAKEKIAASSVKSVLTILGIPCPKLALIFEIGRLLINNREKIARFIKNLFSDKSAEKKMETIEDELTRQVEESMAAKFSEDSAAIVTNILQEQGCFDAISKESNEVFRIDADLLQGFFQSTLKGLIKTSVTGVLGIAK